MRATAPLAVATTGLRAGPGRPCRGFGALGLVVAARDELRPTVACLASTPRVDEATETTLHLLEVDVAVRRRPVR